MAGKTDARRAKLKQDLIGIAQTRIAAGGLASLRARDLAAEAGCAVGAIYNVFGDLSDLVLAVNALTFRDLGQSIAARLEDAPAAPLDQLIAMGRAYHDFAARNPGLWRALFEIDRAEGETAPEWYLAEMGQLLGLIDAPVSQVFPQMPDGDRALFVRALFSSVHGIVWLGLEDASAGVPREELDRMIELLLRQLVQTA